MKQSIRRKLISGVLLLYCLNIMVYLFNYKYAHFWDFYTYYYAGKAYRMGLNPYHTDDLSLLAERQVTLKFVYLPVTLGFFQLFSYLEYTHALYGFLLLKCLLLILLVYLWKHAFLPKADEWFYLLCLLAFNSTIYIDFRAGNISTLESFLIWSGLYCYLRKKYALFCLFTLVAALFKIMPMGFLLLLWLRPSMRKSVYFTLTVLVFLGIQAGTYLLYPEYLLSFLQNLVSPELQGQGIVNPSTLALIRQLGQLLEQLSGLTFLTKGQFVVYGLVIAAIGYESWKAYRHLRNVPHQNQRIIEIFLCCMVYALILPRFKDYAYIILIPPTYFILKETKELPAYPFLFGFTILSASRVYLPEVHVLFSLLWDYYPLFLTYMFWQLYLYYILRLQQQNRNDLKTLS